MCVATHTKRFQDNDTEAVSIYTYYNNPDKFLKYIWVTDSLSNNGHSNVLIIGK